jgi:hypothetical protein
MDMACFTLAWPNWLNLTPLIIHSIVLLYLSYYTCNRSRRRVAVVVLVAQQGVTLTDKGKRLNKV